MVGVYLYCTVVCRSRGLFFLYLSDPDGCKEKRYDYNQTEIKITYKYRNTKAK